MLLRELLSALNTQIKPDPATTLSEIVQQADTARNRKNGLLTKWISFVAISLLILTGLGWYTYNYFRFDNSNNLSGDTAILSPITYVSADMQGQQGVACNTTLTVITKESMSAKQLEEHISLFPEVSYSIKKKGTNRFTLSFDEPLQKNAGYTVNSLVDNATTFRWSLQTETAFAIDSYFPQNHADDIDRKAAINVTFTESGVNAFQEYFSIYPEVEGTFTHKGRIWTFTPKEALLPYTTYTVTIDGSIYGNEEHALGKSTTFSFTTGAGDSDRYIYVKKNAFDIANTFSTTQAPSVTIGAKGTTTTTADVTLHKLPDSDTYLELHKKYGHDTVLSSAIITDVKRGDSTVYAQFSVSAIPDPLIKDTYYLNYPKELETGYYVAEILWNELKCYQLLQSHDLAVYCSFNNDTHTFWINSTQTEQPVSGAKIKIGNTGAQTNDLGLATIKTESDERYAYATINANNLLPYILCCETPASSAGPQNMFNAFLYSDSTRYNVDDTITVWGTISKRYSDADEPVASLVFSRDIETMEVNITGGAYTAEIPLENIKPGALTINLNINGTVVSSKNVTVTSEDDRAHTVLLNTNKNAYLHGENVTATAKVFYNNGLPAANLSGKYNTDVAVTTDKTGTAGTTFAANYGAGIATDPLSKCAPTLFTTEFIYGVEENNVTSPILVFNTDEYIYGTVSKKTPIGCTLDIQTGKIDLQKLNALSDAAFKKTCTDLSTADYAGEPTTKDVTIEVHDVSFERKQSGTYYDTTSNKVQLKYSYTEKDTVVKTLPVTTAGGKLTLNDLSLPTASGYRYLKLITKDSAGRECVYTCYVDQPVNHDAKAFKFECPTQAAYNEVISLKVYDPSAKQALKDGNFIYHLNNGKGSNSFVTEENNASFTYTTDLGAKIGISGVYFSGQHYFSIEPTTLERSDKTSLLTATVSAEKESYQPGEKAKLTLQVNDPDGKPVKNAPFAFNLTTANSAVLSGTAVLNDLTQSSISVPVANVAVETSEADKDAVNDQLVSVGFVSGKTDKNGTAVIQITVPEENDQWIGQAVVITPTTQVGCAITKIKTEADLFVKNHTDNVFAKDSDCIIAFTAGGSNLSDNSKTEINVYSGTALHTTKTIQHGTGLQTVNLGTLPIGDYTCKITVTGKKATTVEFDFSVKEGLQAVENAALLERANGNVSTIILSDKENQRFAALLTQLYSNGGMRIDHVIGRAYAASVLSGTEEDGTSKIADILKAYEINGGYCAYTDQKEPDLLLTAQIASLFPASVDSVKTSGYFDSILTNVDSEYEQVLCALWGKAALGEAVEKDLAYYYAEGNGLTNEQQLYFALAYAYSGNQQKANDIYINRIKTMLIPQEEKLMIKPDNADHTDLCNNLLSLLTARISAKEADQILSYALINDAPDTFNGIEKISFVKEYTPALSGKNTVKLGIFDIGEQSITYAKCAYKIAKINADNDAFSIVDETESTLCTAHVTSNATDFSKDGLKSGAIVCSVPTQAGLNTDVTISITLTPELMATGTLRIHLPTGLKLASIKSNATHWDYTLSPDLSDISIISESKANTTVTLTCKAALLGKFVIEPIIIDGDDKRFVSTSSTISIVDPAALPPADPLAPNAEAPAPVA